MEFDFFNNIWATISSNPFYLAGGGIVVLFTAIVIKKRKKNSEIEDEVSHNTIPEKRHKKHDVESITIETQEFENEYIINEDNGITITREGDISHEYEEHSKNNDKPIESSKIFKNKETCSLIQSAIMLDNLGDRTQALSLLEKIYEIVFSNQTKEDLTYEKNNIEVIISQYKKQLFEPTKSLELIIEESLHIKLPLNLVEKKNETINDIFDIQDDAPTISSLLKNEENSSWLEKQTNEAIHEIQQNKKDNLDIEKNSDISPKGTIGNFSLEEDFNFNKKENNNEEQSQSFNIFDTGENHLENKTFNLHEDNVNKENNIFNTENHSKITDKDKSSDISKNTEINDSLNESKTKNDDLDVLSLLNEVKDVNEFNHAEKTERNNENQISSIEDMMLNIHNQAVSIEETNINEEISEEELLKSLEETKNKEDISTTDNQEPDTSEENKSQEDFMKEFSNMVVNLNNEVTNTPKKTNDDSDTIWINWMLNQNGQIEMKNSTLDLDGKWGTKEAIEQLSLFLDSESGKLYNQEISWGVVSIQTLDKS